MGEGEEGSEESRQLKQSWGVISDRGWDMKPGGIGKPTIGDAERISIGTVLRTEGRSWDDAATAYREGILVLCA